MRTVRKISALLTGAAIFAASAAAAYSHTAAFAANRNDLVQRQQQEQQRIQKLRSELEGVDVDLQKAFLDLEQTRAKIPEAEKALADAQGELSAAEREAEENAALLTAAEKELSQISAEKEKSGAQVRKSVKSLGEFARAAYRGDTAPSAVELVLGSGTAAEFMNAYRISSAITRTQTNALTAHAQENASAKNKEARQDAVRQTVARLKADADEIVTKKHRAKTEAESRRADLQSLENKYDSDAKSLQARKAEFSASIARAQAEQQSIAAEIAAIDAANRRSAAAGRNTGGGGEAAVADTGAGSFLKSPIPPPLHVNSPMGYRIHPVTGERRLHAGVDLRSACGQVQRAAAAGTVVRTSWYGTGGNAIIINHGMINGSSWVTVYLHLSAYRVSVGQHVQQGQVIGLTGATGRVTGCHVHFEVHRNGVVQNPMIYIG